MRQNIFGLGLITIIVALASTAILAVSFQLKEQGSGSNQVAPPQVAFNPPPASSASTTPPATTAEPKSINNNAAVNREAPAHPCVTPAVIPRFDARISPEEYLCTFTGEEEFKLELFWTIDEKSQIIYLALRSPIHGCVGISLGPSGRRMKGGDVLSGYLDESGTLQFRDDYAKEETIHSSDVMLAIETVEGGGAQTQRYGTDNILEKNGRVTPQGTIIEFSRYLNTGDTAFDKAIEPVSMRVQLAYSEGLGFTCFESQNLSQKQINFFTGAVEDEPQS